MILTAIDSHQLEERRQEAEGRRQEVERRQELEEKSFPLVPLSSLLRYNSLSRSHQELPMMGNY